MPQSEPTGISRQQRVGAAARAETRARLEAAAAEEFIEHGYAAATVTRIAQRAGVTVQTLYLACGSKRELLRAFMRSRLTSSLGSRAALSERLGGCTPEEIVTMTARVVRHTAETSAVGWKLYRDASATDPEIAADWDELQAGRRRTFELIVSHIPVEALRPGLDRDAARDTAWAIASPECHELLVRRAGYTLDEFESWMAAALTGALLA